jgi:hypothetical protein
VPVACFPLVHAIPRLSPAVLAERRALERIDADDGSWRVYVTTSIVAASVVLALASLSVVTYPLRTVFEIVRPYDVVGASATLAAIIASIRALMFHQRASNGTSLASFCVIAAWLALAVGVPIVLLGVLVARFGVSA